VLEIVGIWKHVVKKGHKNKQMITSSIKEEGNTKKQYSSALSVSLFGGLAQVDLIAFTLFCLYTMRVSHTRAATSTATVYQLIINPHVTTWFLTERA